MSSRFDHHTFDVMKREDQYYSRISEVISYLQSSVEDQPSLFQIAEKANLSPHHFQRTFKKWVGISPKQYLQVLSLESLKKRLLETKNILLASDDAGYSSSSRVHDLFVNFEGVTPGEFKNKGLGLDIKYGYSITPFGQAFIAWTARGINRISFADEEQDDNDLESLQIEWPEAELVRDDGMAKLKMQSIFSKSKEHIDIFTKGTPFQIKVWQALLNIPDGALTTYQQIANAIGKPKSTRAVGSAIGKNPIAFLIPCHRVIRSDGGMGGYRWGISRKKVMTANEGVNAI